MLTFYLIALFFFTKYALVSAASPGNDCAEGYFDVMLDHFGCSNASFYYCNARGDYDVKDLKASCFGRNATLEDKWYRSFCEDDAWRENALGCNPKQFVEFDFDVNAVSCRGRRSSQLVAVLEEEYNSTVYPRKMVYVLTQLNNTQRVGSLRERAELRRRLPVRRQIRRGRLRQQPGAHEGD